MRSTHGGTDRLKFCKKNRYILYLQSTTQIYIQMISLNDKAFRSIINVACS